MPLAMGAKYSRPRSGGLFLLLLLIRSDLTASSSLACPSASWEKDVGLNRCFRVEDKGPFHRCEEVCDAVDASIATTIPASDVLSKFDLKTGSYGEVQDLAWVGLTDFEEEERWEWITAGGDAAWKWACGSPATEKNCGENCAAVNNDGKLAEKQCTAFLPCLCEYPRMQLETWARDAFDDNFKKGGCSMVTVSNWPTLFAIMGFYITVYAIRELGYCLVARRESKKKGELLAQRSVNLRRSESIMQVARSNVMASRMASIVTAGRTRSNTLIPHKLLPRPSFGNRPPRAVTSEKPRSSETIGRMATMMAPRRSSEAIATILNPRRSFERWAAMAALQPVPHSKVHAREPTLDRIDSSLSDRSVDISSDAADKKEEGDGDKFDPEIGDPSQKIERKIFAAEESKSDDAAVAKGPSPSRSMSFDIRSVATSNPREQLIRRISSISAGETIEPSVQPDVANWKREFEAKLKGNNRRLSSQALSGLDQGTHDRSKEAALAAVARVHKRMASLDVEDDSPGSPHSPSSPSSKGRRRRYSSFAVGRTKEASVQALQNQLREAETAGKQLRWRITNLTQFFGYFLLAVGFALLAFALVEKRPDSLGRESLVNAAGFLVVCGCAFWLLSVMPYDTLMIRYLCAFIYFGGKFVVAGTAVTAAWHWPAVAACDFNFECMPCVRAASEFLQCTVLGTVTGLLTAHIRNIDFHVADRFILDEIWNASGFYMLQCGTIVVLFAAVDPVPARRWQLLPAAGCVVFGFGMIGKWNGVPMRAQVQSWLSSIGSTVTTAAGIASMLGGHEVAHVQAQARQRFRYIAADDMIEEEMLSSTPDHSLYEKSKPVPLGEVDAFLSHSWNDDPKQKWAELQAWREEFKQMMGREPKLWVDKYCEW